MHLPDDDLGVAETCRKDINY